MSNSENIISIKRHYDGSPTIVDRIIEEECLFENSIMEGYGTLIIDKQFITEILKMINNNELSDKLIELLTYINNKIIDYFYNPNFKTKSRIEIYDENCVLDEEGMSIGTKLSSLKGKKCCLV